MYFPSFFLGLPFLLLLIVELLSLFILARSFLRFRLFTGKHTHVYPRNKIRPFCSFLLLASGFSISLPLSLIPKLLIQQHHALTRTPSHLPPSLSLLLLPQTNPVSLTTTITVPPALALLPAPPFLAAAAAAAAAVVVVVSADGGTAAWQRRHNR